ncbi:MAG: hypothetical protein HYV27_08145 [Candidatus Hydrogenedentes bacterium]|nr:hypothetical protein [Candidatus Hydrogenedentota bacterium]
MNAPLDIHHAERKRRPLLRLLQRRGYRVGFLAGILVALPSLFAGFLVDDYVHMSTLEGKIVLGEPWDLFRFADGVPDHNLKWMDSGPFLWYTDTDISLHFFRPLSSATMVLDHVLFDRWTPGMHAHSILWYALLLVAASLIYRRALPGIVGALAFLLFAVEDAHIIPVVWWSNRNAVIAAAPAILGLAAHMRWREARWRPGLPLSLLGYIVGLAGAEGALGIMGYVIAYELIARKDAWPQRFFALVPAGALSVLYLLYYKATGHGVSGSGVYFDPIGEVGLYLSEFPSRFLMMLGQHLFMLPVELPVFFTRLETPLVLASLFLIALTLYVVYRLWPRFAPEERIALQWMTLGALIALPPVLTTFPSSRTLLMPSLGGVVVLALVIRHGLSAVAQSSPRMVIAVSWAFIVLHLVLAPAAWIGGVAGIRIFNVMGQGLFDEFDLDQTDLSARRAIMVSSVDPVSGFYPYVMRMYRGETVPRGWNTLSMAPFDHRVTRTGPNTFEVEVVNGELFTNPFERLLRSHERKMRPGDRVDLTEFTIEVLECGDWGPKRFRFEGKYSLDDPRYCFVSWQGHALREFRWAEQPASFDLRMKEGYIQQFLD